MTESRRSDEEIRALCDAATPGPWETRQTDDGQFYGQPPTFDLVTLVGGREESVVCGGPVEAGGPTLGAAEGPDAEFIAAARELVPSLLAEVRSLRGVVQAVRELCDERELHDSWRRNFDGSWASHPVLEVPEVRAALAAAADAPQTEPVAATDVPPLPNDLEPQPEWCIVSFFGGPWNGQQYQAERVVGPLFAVGHEVGNHYWLDTKSDPPTYHWDGTPWESAGPSPAVLPQPTEATECGQRHYGPCGTWLCEQAAPPVSGVAGNPEEAGEK